MMKFTPYLAAAAAIGGLAAPLSAQGYGYPQPAYPQSAYPQAVPQPYPGQPGYGYGQQVNGYGQQGYSTGNPVTDIIDSLLGNRYNVTDRQAVRQCANAARTQAMQQYGGGYANAYGNNGYNNAYRQPYAGNLRVSAITSVERRNNGLRVSGTMTSGGGYGGQYGNQYGYRNQAYAQGDVSFRCNVDYRGAVTNVRIGRNMAYAR